MADIAVGSRYSNRKAEGTIMRALLQSGRAPGDGQETLAFLSPCDATNHATVAPKEKPEKFRRPARHQHLLNSLLQNEELPNGIRLKPALAGMALENMKILRTSKALGHTCIQPAKA